MSFGFGFGFPRRLTSGGGLSPSLYLDFVGTGSLPSTVTFSRGTNATLTDSNGRIAWAPHNLLTNSEDFEAAAWAKSNATVTANVTVAPDGTTTADKLVEDATTNVHYVGVNAGTVGIQETFSFYAKAAERTWCAAQIGNNGVAYYDLQNGVTGTVTNSTASIVSVGNGWFRCSISATRSGNFNNLIYPAAANNSVNYTGNGTSGIFIWGAQLNVGSTAQSYNSTTPKNLLGFTQEPENAAWTKSNSYVQQNLLTWSQDFDNAAWLKRDGSVTDNATTAPDGTLTADKLIPAAASVIGRTQQNYIGSADTTYTLSVYAKQGEFSALRLYADDNASNIASVYFNLISGAITTGPAVSGTWTGVSATSAPANAGWYRFTLTWTATGAAPVRFQFWNPNTGDGTSGIFIWGAQLVQGSTAGDYTQTTSAAAPTRYLNWDGTLTGRKLVETTAASTHIVLQIPTVSSSTTYTYSVFLKAAERTRASLQDGGGSSAAGYFNLSNGTVISTVAATATILNAGNGWYRCTITFTTGVAQTAINTRIFLVDTGTNISYTGDGTSGIYVSDFQLSNSASVDPYVYNPQAAAASAAYYGPRFDYDPTGTPVLSGTELRGTGSISTIGSPGTLATYNVSTGAGSAYRLDGSNSSGVQIVVTDGRTYLVDVEQLTGSLQIRGTNPAGTVLVSSVSGRQRLLVYVGGSEDLFFVSGANAAGTTFNIYSVQEVTGYTATANGLLIEEQRTNLLTYSEDFSAGPWSKANLTITPNATTSPSGATNAQQVTATATAATSLIQDQVVNATSATFTVYVKTGSGATDMNVFIVRNVTTSTNLLGGSLNYTTGVWTYAIGSSGVSVSNAGNGWWRLEMVMTSGITSGNTLRPYVGSTGVSLNAGVFAYFWGAQLEAGSFATSYIPTVASQVTRNADSASMLGDNFYTWYNPNQGTLGGEFSAFVDSGSYFIASISDGTNNNRIQLLPWSSRQGQIVTGGVDQALFDNGTIAVNTVTKVALAYAPNNAALSLSGASPATDNTVSLPPADRMLFGNATTGTSVLNGTIRRISYYNTRLPDSTLQALTTT